MYRLIFLLIQISIFCFSDNSYEKSNYIDTRFENVDLLTGKYFFKNEIKVSGKENIILDISYLSLELNDPRSRDDKFIHEFVLSGWSFFDHYKAFFYGDRIEVLYEGTKYVFDYPKNRIRKKIIETKKEKKKRELTEGYFEKEHYLLSLASKKNINSSNNKNIFVLKAELNGINNLQVEFSNGVKQIYIREKGNTNSNYYLLNKTVLSNKNKILYFFDKFQNLLRIETKNFDETKIYSYAEFSYKNPDKKNLLDNSDKHDFGLKTSDGQIFNFIFDKYYPIITNKEKSNYPFYFLKSIASNQMFNNFDYHTNYKRTSPLLKSIILPENNNIFIEYYLLGNKNSSNEIIYDNNDFRFQKVLNIQTLDQNGNRVIIYRFEYEKSSSNFITKVYDDKNNLISYTFDQNKNLIKIERFFLNNGANIPFNSEQFIWENINDFNLLKSRSFLDGKGNTKFSKEFTYDSNNNLIKEKIIGAIKSDNANDEFLKFYIYEQSKLKSIEEEGVLTKLEYFEDSFLLKSKISYIKSIPIKRNFYFYDSDFSLIKEMEDDGKNENYLDLKDLTYREIKNFRYLANFPYLRNEISLENFDIKSSKEIILQKESLIYSGLNLIKKEIFDKNRKKLFESKYEYDERKNLLSIIETGDKKTFFKYDNFNNLIYKKDNQNIETFYNYSNGFLISKLEKDTNFSKSYKYEYDKYSNLLKIEDSNNFVKIFEYDPFFNIKKIITTDLINDKVCNIEEYLEYDALGRLVKKRCGEREEIFAYNIFNQIFYKTLNGKVEENYLYNIDKTINSFTDNNGITTKNSYVDDKIQKSTIFSSQNKLLNEVLFTYDGKNLVQKKDFFSTEFYEYDYLGNVLSERTKDGSSDILTNYYYDNNGLFQTKQNKLIKSIHKDKFNRTILEEERDIFENLYFKKEYEYDKNSISTISYINDKKSKETKEFDDRGRLLKVIDPLNNISTYFYDEKFEYNGFYINREIFTNHLNEKKETLYFCDKIIEIKKTDSKDKIFYLEKNIFDEYGNIISQTIYDKLENKNVSEKNKYDNFGRITLKERIDNLLTTQFEYTYFKNGYIEKITKRDCTFIEKEYDFNNNLLSIKSSTNDINYKFEYNSKNLLIKIFDLNNNSVVLRDYNASNQLISETFANGLILKFDYDLSKRKVKAILPDNSYVFYKYDPFNLSEVERYNFLNQKVYTYKCKKFDLSKNLIEEEIIGELNISKNTNYNLKKLKELESNFGIKKSSEFDELNRLNKMNWKIFWAKDNSSLNYENLSKTMKENLITNNDLNNTNILYEKDILGRIYKKTENNRDAYFTYDSLDRLLKIEKGNILIKYEYDGLDRRVSKTIYEDQKEVSYFDYIYEGRDEIGSFDANNRPYQLKISGGTKPIAFELNDEIFAPIFDNMGNISTLISLNKGIVETYKFDFITKKLILNLDQSNNKKIEFTNPWKYLENRFDEDINLIFLDNKFYDRANQKFLDKNNFSFISDKSINNVFLNSLEGEIVFEDFAKKESNFSECRIKVENLFGNFNMNFSENSNYNVLEKEKIITLTILKAVFEKITNEHISLDQILDSIRRPMDIQIEDNIFILTGKNVKTILDMENREIIGIEKIL